MKTEKRFSKKIFLVIFILIIISNIVINGCHLFFSQEPLFSNNETGILVLKIEGDKQDSLQIHLVKSLNKKLNEAGIEVKRIDASVSISLEFRQAHQKARDIGKENNAFLVIHGEIAEPNTFHPRLTIVKDSIYSILTGNQIMSKQNINEINFPVDIIEYQLGLKNFVMGYFLFMKNEFSEAIPYFEQALKLTNQDKMESVNFLLYLGLCHHELYEVKDKEKNLNQAFKYVNQAIKLNPKNPILFFNRGNVYYTNSNFDNALSDYDEAITIDSGNPLLFLNRGNVYYQIDKYDSALLDYNRAIKINPKFAASYFNRGNIYFKQTQYDTALSDFNTAIKLNPKLAFAYLNRGYIYFLQEQFDFALSDFNNAIEIYPNFIEAYKKRSIVYEEVDQIQNALSDRSRIIELKPSDYFGYIDRGLIYTNEKQFDLAISDYNKAIELNKRSADAYYCKAFTYHIMGELKEAISAYKKFIQYSSANDLENVKSAKQSIKELELLLNE